MFAAAMLYATPSLELSIYSTCKRISQKLMRNVIKFLDLIYLETKDQPMQVIRSNMEEVVLKGPDGILDIRTVNSYPSKVGALSRALHLARKVLARKGGLVVDLAPLVSPVEVLDQKRLRVHVQRLQCLLLPPQIALEIERNLTH